MQQIKASEGTFPNLLGILALPHHLCMIMMKSPTQADKSGNACNFFNINIFNSFSHFIQTHLLYVY